MHIAPLRVGEDVLGAAVTYVDLTGRREDQEELERSRRELSGAYEELQSTNEELETMNDELSLRTLEVNDANAVMETILSSLGVALAVIDGNLRVRDWNLRAEELWGLRREEAEGQDLTVLDIGLSVQRLGAPLRACLGGDSPREEAVLEAVDRRGQTLRCRVTILPLAVAAQTTRALVLMERQDPES